jgi:hypothetical protein
MDHRELAKLRAERDTAWRDFNPSWPPGPNNDWPRFAQANAAWERAYAAIHGHRPAQPFDEIDEQSSRYYRAVRYPDRRERPQPKTDADRDKGNRRRQEQAKKAATAAPANKNV